MQELNKINLEEILELSNFLPLPLQCLFLKTLKLTLEEIKKGEKNG